MDVLDLHRQALAEFDRTVHSVGADQWDNPTPCTEWTVRDLVNHLVAEQRWAPHLLGGATLAEVGDRYDGGVLGEDPVRAWEESAKAAREAWTHEGTIEGRVRLSFGEVDASLYCWQMTGDLAVHAWDLAMGIGAPQPIEDDLAEVLVRVVGPIVESSTTPGILAPPVEVPATASAPDRLVALMGRVPR
ncbi:TIGR03086 family metal-binding protein [Amycolatopsis sp. PS_44_ISF1]|uniref:TIGR03086 family metal-binding protein n=1 Tax=Amycolatopsis sp. PS_44_ISF1 TaxID=2974917 RepID=UPI0028DF1408|nr:TIGR03086 family metal-binding protein [Amycolatopsis sp. PS_44_ISF1]MDT8912817.1 TIGR03086 family metal-binding protein [Amycolatopsis sp. PS_44_ISF1]